MNFWMIIKSSRLWSPKIATWMITFERRCIIVFLFHVLNPFFTWNIKFTIWFIWLMIWNSPYFKNHIRLTNCTIINRVFWFCFFLWSLVRRFVKIDNQCIDFIFVFLIVCQIIIIGIESTLTVDLGNFLHCLVFLEFNNWTCGSSFNDRNGIQLIMQYAVQWNYSRKWWKWYQWR